MFQQIENKFIGQSTINDKMPVDSSNSAFTSTFEEPKKKQKTGTMSPLKERPRKAPDIGSTSLNITSSKVQEILAKFSKQDYKHRPTAQTAFDFMQGTNPELSKLKSKPKIVSKKSSDRTTTQIRVHTKESTSKDKMPSSRIDPIIGFKPKEIESSISKNFSSSRFIFDYNKDKLWSRDSKAERSVLQRNHTKNDKSGDKTFDYSFKPLKTKKKSMPSIIDEMPTDQLKPEKPAKVESPSKISSLKQILKEKPLQTILRTDTRDNLTLDNHSTTNSKPLTSALQLQNNSMNVVSAEETSKLKPVSSGSPKSKPRIKVFFNEKRSNVASHLLKELPKQKKPESPKLNKEAKFSRMTTDDLRPHHSPSRIKVGLRSKSNEKLKTPSEVSSQQPTQISNVHIINSNIYFPVVGFNPKQKKTGYIDIQMEDRINRPKSPSKSSQIKLSRVYNTEAAPRMQTAKEPRAGSSSTAADKHKTADCYSTKQENKKSASLAPLNGFHSPSRRDKLKHDISKNKDDGHNTSDHNHSLQIGSSKPRGDRRHLIEYSDKLLSKNKQTQKQTESLLHLQSFKKTKSSRESIDISKKNFKSQLPGQKSDSSFKPIASLVEDESALTEFTQIEEMVSRSMSRNKKPLLDESVLMNSSMLSPILSFTKKIFTKTEHNDFTKAAISNEFGLHILDSLKESFDLTKSKDPKILSASKNIDLKNDKTVETSAVSPTGKSGRFEKNPKGPLYPISADKKVYYISSLQEALKGSSDPQSETFLEHLKNSMVSLSYVKSIDKPHEDEFLSKRVYLPPLSKKGSCC